MLNMFLIILLLILIILSQICSDSKEHMSNKYSMLIQNNI